MADFEVEQNNTIVTANAGTLGKAIGGQLLSASDVDYFSFTVSESTTLNWQFDPQKTGTFRVSIFSSSNLTSPLASYEQNLSSSTFSASTAGTYFFGISSVLIDNSFYDSSQYTLTVSTTSALAENEGAGGGNDTSLTANVVPANIEVIGQLKSAMDKDYFSFLVTNAGILSVSFDAPPDNYFGAYSFKVSVYATDGTLIASHLTDDDIPNFNFSALASGTYYVSVETSTSSLWNDGDYRLKVSSSDVATMGSTSLLGGEGNDHLLGTSGDDIIDGGLGADTMNGGEGNDSYFIDAKKDKVVELSNEGTDTVTTTLNNYSLAENVEGLILSGEVVSGTGNQLDNTITGNELDNKLTGKDGADTLDGGLGNDKMTGGKGNDVYVIDSDKDKIVEAANGGNDTINTKNDLFKLPSNIEKVVLLDGVTYANGNNAANFIVGNSSYNNLQGMGGNDTLSGQGGNDELRGGKGNDVLEGNSGNDFFIFDSSLSANNIDSILDFEAGIDKIMLSHSIFSKLSNGALSSTNFSGNGITAQDGDDMVLFDSGTGMLYYDKDAAGTFSPVAFAKVTIVGTGSLTADDFVIL